MDQKVALIVDY